MLLEPEPTKAVHGVRSKVFKSVLKLIDRAIDVYGIAILHTE